MIGETICGYLTKICAYSGRGMTIRGENKNGSLQNRHTAVPPSPVGADTNATGVKAV